MGVTQIRGGLQSAWPDRMKMKFTVRSTGFIGSGTASYSFGILGNSPYLPFATTLFTNNMPNPYIANNALNPLGLSEVLGTTLLYQTFRCYASKIKVKVMPAGLSDQGFLYVTPGILQGTGATVTNYADLAHVANGVYTKSQLMNVGGKNTLSHYMDCATLFGKTKRAVQDQDEFMGSRSAVPANTWGWIIGYGTSDDQNLAQNLGLDVQMTFFVELQTQPYGKEQA